MGAPRYSAIPRGEPAGLDDLPALPGRRNPYYTEEALYTLAAIYSWNEVQRALREHREVPRYRQRTPPVESEEALSGTSTREISEAELRQGLINGGAEPWMFQPLPRGVQERQRFFAENGPKDETELRRIFPRYTLINPTHAQGVGRGEDPFQVREGEYTSTDPEQYLDWIVIDGDKRWEGALLQSPYTGEPEWLFFHPMYTEQERGLEGSFWTAARDTLKATPGYRIASAAHHGVSEQFPATQARLAEDTAARLRGERGGDYNRGYWAEMARLQNLPPDESLLAAVGGFANVFEGATLQKELEPRFTVWRGPGPANIIPTRGDIHGSLSVPGPPGVTPGIQTERYEVGGEEEQAHGYRMGVAEARNEVMRRSGVQQRDLTRAQQRFDEGEISEDDLRDQITTLLGRQRIGDLQGDLPAPEGETPTTLPDPQATPTTATTPTTEAVSAPPARPRQYLRDPETGRGILRYSQLTGEPIYE